MQSSIATPNIGANSYGRYGADRICSDQNGDGADDLDPQSAFFDNLNRDSFGRQYPDGTVRSGTVRYHLLTADSDEVVPPPSDDLYSWLQAETRLRLPGTDRPILTGILTLDLFKLQVFHSKIHSECAVNSICVSILENVVRDSVALNTVTVGSTISSVDSSDQITVSSQYSADKNGNSTTTFERSTSSAGPWTSVCSAVIGPSPRVCVISGLNSGTTYFARITFIDPDGVLGNSQQILGPLTTLSSQPTEPPTGGAIPSAPSNLALYVIASDRITVQWSDNSDNESGFVVQRKVGSSLSFEELIKIGSRSGTGASLSHLDSGLTPGVTYCYRIFAYNAVGNSPYSSESCATPQLSTAPPIVNPPSNLSASATSSNSIALSWLDNSDNESTFELERRTGVSGAFNQVFVITGRSGTGNVLNYTDIGLTPATTYCYRVRSHISTDVNSPYTAEMCATTPAVSSQPRELLSNGSFSDNTDGWIKALDFWYGSDLPSARYRTAPGWAAGGVNSSGAPKINANGSIYQGVTIPAAATSAMLTFWLNVTSDELTTTADYDHLYLMILDATGGTVLETRAHYSNRDNMGPCGTTCMYEQQTFDLTKYAGRAIRILFLATTDSARNTVFRIDDVSLLSDG